MVFKGALAVCRTQESKDVSAFSYCLRLKVTLERDTSYRSSQIRYESVRNNLGGIMDARAQEWYTLYTALDKINVLCTFGGTLKCVS